MWDELFLRHDRERQELLRWEDTKALKRSSSLETIKRESTRIDKRSRLTADSDYMDAHLDEADQSSRSRSVESHISPDPSPPPDSDDDETGILCEFPASDFSAVDMGYRDVDTESSSSVFSAESERTSETDSSSGTQWDVLDSSSAETSLTFEDDSDFE